MTELIENFKLKGLRIGRTVNLSLCDVFEVTKDDNCCNYTLCLNDDGATNNQVLTTDGNGNFFWSSKSDGNGIAAVVDDPSPQLGGNLDLNTHDITGTGNINITGNIEASGYGDFGNIRISGNSITSTDANGNINITPNGSGYIYLDGLRFPNVDGTNGQVLTTNGAGVLSWTTVSGGGFVCADLNGCSIDSLLDVVITAPVASQYLTFNGAQWINTNAPGGGITAIVQDTNPNLGGNLDVNGHSIVASGGADININAAGSGTTIIEGIEYPNTDGTANQIMGTSGAGVISFGNITLTAGSNITFGSGSPAVLGIGSNLTINSTGATTLVTTKVQIFEDFVLGLNSDHWSGTILYGVNVSEADHIGIAYPTDFMQSADSFRFADLDYLKVSARLNDISLTGAATRVSIGFIPGVSTTERINFYYEVGGTNWFAETRDANVSTTTDTGIAIALTWVTFEIVKSGANVVFKINGATVATHSTNIHAGYLPIKISTTVNEINPVGVDYVAYESQVLTR